MEKQLPKNWVECTLSDVFEIVTGNTPSKSYPEYYGEDIPWVKPGDINRSVEIYETEEYLSKLGFDKSRKIPKGSVMVTCIGNLGNIAIAGTELATNQQINTIVISHNLINKKYVYYRALTFKKWLVENSTSTTIAMVNKSNFEKLPFLLPPLPEQTRIVAKLDTLFAQLETIKASMANIPLLLKNFRQQVLTQAVTGKLTGCKVEIKRLGDLLTDVKYGTSMKSEYGIDGSPIFRIPNINDGVINDTDLKYSILDDKEYNQLKLVEGDVLIIRSNGSVSLVGRSAIIRKKHEGFAYAGYLIRLRCRQELNSEFLNYTLKSDFLRTQIVKVSHSSSGVNNINSQEIKDLKIFWTKPKEQQEIVSRVESLFAKVDAIEEQYKLLKEKIDALPQALLHKAFKGELTEQLESDGDARELLQQIEELKGATTKVAKNTKLEKLKSFNKKIKNYSKSEDVLGMVAKGK